MNKKAILRKQNIFTLVFVLAGLTSFAQNSVIISGQDPSRRVITTAVPFLNFAPDSRHSAMGDVGVATSPDANSTYWNAGKLAFIKDDYGFSLSYSPWLGKLVNDMSLSYLSGYKRIDENSVLDWTFATSTWEISPSQMEEAILSESLILAISLLEVLIPEDYPQT